MKTRLNPRLMLFSRITLFLIFQFLTTILFLIVSKNPAVEKSADWWPITIALADLVCLFLLIAAFRGERMDYWRIFHIDRQHLWGDLLALLVLTVLAAPLTYLPNVILAKLLYSDPTAVTALFYRPMPYWAAYLSILAFPILQGLTETPTYFGYVMPRFEAQGMNKWLAISIPALMLAAQHIAMPFLLDFRFIVWRGLMFLPFAFLVAIVFHWRPRLLPYFIVVHVLMNLATIITFLSVAY